MGMNGLILAIPKESMPIGNGKTESRVALTPADVNALKSLGFFREIRIDHQAGICAGFVGRQYKEAGAVTFSNDKDLFSGADVVLRVRRPSTEIDAERNYISQLSPETVVVGFIDPLIQSPVHLIDYARQKLSSISYDLLPKIAETADMDVSAGMGKITGTIAINDAKDRLRSLREKNVLIIGAGNAGLQSAIDAKKFGAHVLAISGSNKHQSALESHGIQFRAMPNDNIADQKQFIIDIASGRNGQTQFTPHVVVTAARRVGVPAPQLLDAPTYAVMPGALIYDLAKSSGGNCMGSDLNKDVNTNGVTLICRNGYPGLQPCLSSPEFSVRVAKLVAALVDPRTPLATSTALSMSCAIADGTINPRSGLNSKVVSAPDAFMIVSARIIQNLRNRA